MRTRITVRRHSRPGALALLAVSFAAICGGAGVTSALAQSASSASPNVAAVATDPARDAAMKTYLQKHFKIASPDLIRFGPAVQTSIPGLLGRQMTVSNVEGQSVNTALFFDKTGTKMIIGSFLDTSAEPWGRVDLGGIHLDDNPALGPADAPITVVEFADFECPLLLSSPISNAPSAHVPSACSRRWRTRLTRTR